jgi:alpha-glucuronidase
MQQGGMQQGGMQQGGNLGPNGGGGYSNGGGNAYGNWQGVQVDPRGTDYQAQYRNTVQSLQQLQQQLKNDPATAKDIAALLQQLRQLDPYTYANDPLLAQRIQAAVMTNVEQVELELRRKVEETNGGDIRSPGTEKVPPGYSDATAEYFKKLSKTNK